LKRLAARGTLLAHTWQTPLGFVLSPLR
jgi:hypothetical protein